MCLTYFIYHLLLEITTRMAHLKIMWGLWHTTCHWVMFSFKDFGFLPTLSFQQRSIPIRCLSPTPMYCNFSSSTALLNKRDLRSRPYMHACVYVCVCLCVFVCPNTASDVPRCCRHVQVRFAIESGYRITYCTPDRYRRRCHFMHVLLSK